MANSNVYVSGLPAGLDDATFRGLFEGYGTITSSKLFAEKKYGFVKFSSVDEASYVAQNFNGQQVGDAQIVVKIAHNDAGQGGGKGFGKNEGGKGAMIAGFGAAPAVKADQVYVKGLPAGLTQEMLQEIFSNYGTVRWSKVMPNDGKPNSVAMVQMSSDSEAQWLVDNLNGNIPQGCEGAVEVKLATPKSKGMGKGMDKGGYGAMKGGFGGGFGAFRSSPYGGCGGGMMALGGGGGGGKGPQYADGDPSNLYVKGLPPTADELYLYKLFAPFGAIESVMAKQSEQFAIGFVKYVQAQEAAVAIQTLTGQMTPEGTVIQVAVKTPKTGGKGK